MDLLEIATVKVDLTDDGELIKDLCGSCQVIGSVREDDPYITNAPVRVGVPIVTMVDDHDDFLMRVYSYDPEVRCSEYVNMNLPARADVHSIRGTFTNHIIVSCYDGGADLHVLYHVQKDITGTPFITEVLRDHSVMLHLDVGRVRVRFETAHHRYEMLNNGTVLIDE